MKKTKNHPGIVILALVSLLLLAGCGKQIIDKPNVVFILTDQWRSTAMGYAGDPNIKTPNLDRFAEDAVTFRNAVSVCPVCTPYRASLLTGRFPTSTGMFLNDAYLPPEELCLAEVYAENGYNTAYIGKWHLDGQGRMDFTPRERRQGFDYWKALECSHDYNNMPYYEGDSPEIKYWEGYSPFAVSQDAQSYLADKSNEDKPFFLFVAFATPHFPHHSAPEEYKSIYDKSSFFLAPNVPEALDSSVREELLGYYAHCSATDKAVGDLLQKIEDLQLMENTMIVFTSDHGESMGAQGVRIKQKQVPWFEIAGVPLIIHYPSGKTGKIGSLDMSVTTPDISATIIELSGIAIPESFEGISFADAILTGKDEPDRASLYMAVAPFASVRKEYKREYRAVKTANYTYVRGLEGPWLLYDDKKDPYQMKNLVEDSEYTAILEKLDLQLQEELARINDDFRPGATYISEWGYSVMKAGHIPYQNYDQEPQIPKRDLNKKWEPLFKDDLSNAIDESGVWSVENGILSATADACIFSKSEYENFEIDLEFKNETGTNSGVIVYCTDRKDWIPNSVEIQISDDNYFKDKGWEPTWMCGGIFGHLAPSQTLVHDPGEWNHMNIRCMGQHIVVKLNGTISADMDMSKWTDGKKNPDGTDIPSWLPKPFAELPTKGFVGLQGKHGEAKIYFRNIRTAQIQ